MNNPSISVVMGVFDGAGLLPETVDSVLKQTERNFEFIIVNDGSTDSRVAQILTDYERRDGRVRIVSKSNEGLTKALIDGCAVARGAYIARIDAGDVMLPERLEKQKALLDRNPEVVFVSCWTEFCGPEWESLYIYKGKGTLEGGESVLPDRPEENLRDVPCHHGSVMFRHDTYEAAGGYRWQFYYAQDWDLWYRLAERGLLAIIPEVLYRARVFSTSISAINMDRQTAIVKQALSAFCCRRRGEPEMECLASAAKIRSTGGLSEKRKDQGAGSHFIGELLRKKGDARCRRYFLKALRVNFFRFNTWIRLLQSFHGINARSSEPADRNAI